jgi:hypothetical protein
MPAAQLILGPMLRYLSATEATVWVETDGPGTVEVLGRTASTFHVAGRHYAVVAVRDLAPGSSTPYEVRIDGALRWPPERDDVRRPRRPRRLEHLGVLRAGRAGHRVVARAPRREGRVVADGRREMMDEREWAWTEAQLTGDYDHVLIANTLPVLLAPTLHYVEAWNEAVCDGAWGRWAQRPGEQLRRALDLEHWAAFQHSFHRLIALVGDVGSGRRGRAPASIVMLGGDVHQAYLEQVGFRPARGVTTEGVRPRIRALAGVDEGAGRAAP